MDSTDVPSIVDFLTARLDELERWASRCATLYPSPWDCSDRGCMAAVRADAPYFPVVAELNQDQAPAGTGVWLGEYLQHIAAHDPAFVLADIAAKRKIVLRLAATLNFSGPDDPDAWNPYEYQALASDQTDARWMLNVLAQPYADHPDFDPAWTV